MTEEEKNILLKEINGYIKENCYYGNGSLKYYDLWLVGWVAEEFNNRKNAMRVLISNEYGLLGNLLYKLAQEPDASITKFIEQTDLEILVDAIDGGGEAVLKKNKLCDNAYAMRLLLRYDAKYLSKISDGLLKSKAFLLSVVGFCPGIIKDCFSGILADDCFVLSLIKKNYVCLRYLPQKFRQSYEICLEAAREDGFSLMYFDLAVRERDEIVLAAVSSRGNALSLASPRQKKNRDIVYAAVKNCGLALSYADSSWKNDFELVSLAVGTHGMALKYASAECQDCDEIVRIAVENDGYAIRSASARLRDNYELAVLAISSYADAYKYLSPELQNNPVIKDLYFLKKEEENKWLLSKMR